MTEMNIVKLSKLCVNGSLFFSKTSSCKLRSSNGDELTINGWSRASVVALGPLRDTNTVVQLLSADCIGKKP